jgi:hypothetical protein
MPMQKPASAALSRHRDLVLLHDNDNIETALWKLDRTEE